MLLIQRGFMEADLFSNHIQYGVMPLNNAS